MAAKLGAVARRLLEDLRAVAIEEFNAARAGGNGVRAERFALLLKRIDRALGLRAH